MERRRWKGGDEEEVMERRRWRGGDGKEEMATAKGGTGVWDDVFPGYPVEMGMKGRAEEEHRVVI
ncbi:hypothetical protein EYF80_006717 [Liparis tanakae]|uniref:Uncharacterized protein n=1 Tax=Liparis tanakae TaxID=230148 RepID=A0A4Z2IYP8_9TELE|nr:hypothetical protein EYF80_006717 [Liparis tanakae]